MKLLPCSMQSGDQRSIAPDGGLHLCNMPLTNEALDGGAILQLDSPQCQRRRHLQVWAGHSSVSAPRAVSKTPAKRHCRWTQEWTEAWAPQARHTLLSSDPTFSSGRSNTSTATYSSKMYGECCKAVVRPCRIVHMVRAFGGDDDRPDAPAKNVLFYMLESHAPRRRLSAP